MGVWNAVECWFLQRLVLGIRSSVGTLALPLRPLYSNISLLFSSFSWGIPILIVQECQPYSHFHNCNYLSQIWQRAFAGFLIFPGELHLGDPKPNCHNPGLGASILYKLPFTSCGQEYKFFLRNPRVLLALVQTLLTCIVHLKSLVIVTPGHFKVSSLHGIWSMDRLDPFSCQLHHIAFDRLKSHTPLLCPGTHSINIPLKFHCVYFILNITIANTVIRKKSYFRLNIWWDVIYVQTEQQ